MCRQAVTRGWRHAWTVAPRSAPTRDGPRRAAQQRPPDQHAGKADGEIGSEGIRAMVAEMGRTLNDDELNMVMAALDKLRADIAAQRWVELVSPRATELAVSMIRSATASEPPAGSADWSSFLAPLL